MPAVTSSRCDLAECDGGYCCQRCEWTGPKYIHRMCPAIKTRGLGDVIAKIAKRLGFKKCQACSRRQRALNKLTGG